MKIRTVQAGLTTAPSRLPSLIDNELKGPRYSRVDRSELLDTIESRPQEAVEILRDEAVSMSNQAKWRGRASTLTKIPGYTLAAATAAGGVAAGVISFSVLSSLSMQFFDGLGALAGTVAGGVAGFYVAKGGVLSGLYLAGKIADADLYSHREMGRQASAVADLSKRVGAGLAQPEPISEPARNFPAAPHLSHAEGGWQQKMQGVEALADNGHGQLLVAQGNSLTAVNARRGNRVWQKDFDGALKGPIQNTQGNEAYVVSGHQVVALDPRTGEQTGSYGSAWSNSSRTPDLDVDAQGERLYVTNQDSRAAAYDPAKEKYEWSFLGHMRGALPPAAGPQNTAALASENRVILVDAEGESRWQALLPETVTQQPMIDRNQNVYVATGSGLKALDNRFGLERWSVAAEGISQAPLAGPDDSVLVSDRAGVSAYSDSGEALWQLPVGPNRAQLDPYGRLVVSGAAGKTYLVEPEKGEVLRELEAQAGIATVVDGQLVTLAGDQLSARPLYQQPSQEGNWGTLPLPRF